MSSLKIKERGGVKVVILVTLVEERSREGKEFCIMEGRGGDDTGPPPREEARVAGGAYLALQIFITRINISAR